jgi:hypothetical protein
MRSEDSPISFREELRYDSLLSTGFINISLNGFLISRTNYHHSANIIFSVGITSKHSSKLASEHGNITIRLIEEITKHRWAEQCRLSTYQPLAMHRIFHNQPRRAGA